MLNMLKKWQKKAKKEADEGEKNAENAQKPPHPLADTLQALRKKLETILEDQKTVLDVTKFEAREQKDELKEENKKKGGNNENE